MHAVAAAAVSDRGGSFCGRWKPRRRHACCRVFFRITLRRLTRARELARPVLWLIASCCLAVPAARPPHVAFFFAARATDRGSGSCAWPSSRLARLWPPAPGAQSPRLKMGSPRNRNTEILFVCREIPPKLGCHSRCRQCWSSWPCGLFDSHAAP